MKTKDSAEQKALALLYSGIYAVPVWLWDWKEKYSALSSPILQQTLPWITYKKQYFTL